MTHRVPIALLVAAVIFTVALGGELHAQNKPRREPPFEIWKRPMPAGTDLEKLVPKTVGTFERPAFPRGAKPPVDEDLNVTYKSGTDTIDFGFSIPETPADAHDAVKVTRDEAIRSKVSLAGEEYSVKTEPSFFRTADFCAWTRGRYFFYAKANNAKALDAFMRAFPY